MSEARDFLKDSRSSLARMLGAQAIPHRIVDDFPGVGGRFAGQAFALCAVSAEEILRATSAAVKWLVDPAGAGLDRGDLLTETGEGCLDFETKCQLLFRALRDPADVTRPLAGSVDELRALLYPDEVRVLYERHVDYERERSPISQARAWGEVEANIEAMGKGSAPPTLLSGFDAATLRLITTELASRLYGPTKPSSSGTSPPNG